MKVLDAVVCLFALVCVLIGVVIAGDRPVAVELGVMVADVAAAEYIAPVEVVPELPEVLPVEEADWRDAIPLDSALVDKLVVACDTYEVPFCLALGVMEQESGFVVDALNSLTGCYGLMQLNPAYFPAGLDAAGSIDAGVAYLGQLLDTYGNLDHAVTAYYYGPTDRVSSWYSDEVLALAEEWELRLGEVRD